MTAAKIIPGAETFYLPGSSVGILLCHGFNGTPQSVRYLGEKLASKGLTIYAPRLKGHGINELEMEKTKYQDWIENMDKAYKKLKETCAHIFVMGQSMGGALALDLASKLKCDGVITVNAALEVPDYEPYRHRVTPRFISEGEPDIKAKGIKEITYTQVPLTAIHQLQGIMEHSRRQLKKIRCPALIFHSPEDHVVPSHCSELIYESISSKDKELATLANSYHVASLDYDKDQIIDQTYHFINKHVTTKTIAS